MREIIILAHNIQSTHNIGAIFRTAEGFGVKEIWFSGYTPYPDLNLSSSKPSADSRLPHIRAKLSAQIHKTALGAETMVPFRFTEDIALATAQNEGYHLVALEQSAGSTSLADYQPTDKIALLIGEERHGIEETTLKKCDEIVEIPMFGQKESFNVSVATGIVLYHMRLG